MDYKERFKNISLETKRQDLLIHPFVDKDKIKNATDEEIEVVYHIVFSSMDIAMQDILGESLFDEE